ncbi:hypothetical protein A2U01_0072927, partial [Trifolium medium]|nr:hypothetical protein [Trifolium medium]
KAPKKKKGQNNEEEANVAHDTMLHGYSVLCSVPVPGTGTPPVLPRYAPLEYPVFF